MTESDSRFDVQPSVGNHFAWIRTQMGLQRTLMAGVRTAISLIGFGFTVAQFFQKTADQAADSARKLGPEAPRHLGMILIATGVLSLVVFLWQYHRATRYLDSGPFQGIGTRKKPLHTSTYLIASVVILIGVAAFLSVLARF